MIYRPVPYRKRQYQKGKGNAYNGERYNGLGGFHIRKAQHKKIYKPDNNYENSVKHQPALPLVHLELFFAMVAFHTFVFCAFYYLAVIINRIAIRTSR